jgi:hypothetical protein
MPRARTLRLLALAAGLALLPAACGDDDSDGGGTTTTPVGDDGRELVVLSAQEVCDAVPADVAGEALGLEVTAVEASDTGATPQCAYTYESATGGPSNVTIAAMDTNAVGDRAGDEAFDYVADINRQTAGGAAIEEAEVDAGDRALRFTGPAIHLGVVAVGDNLLTVIVPLDAGTDAVDSLLVAVADAVAAD